MISSFQQLRMREREPTRESCVDAAPARLDVPSYAKALKRRTEFAGALPSNTIAVFWV
jgi:hypothetical protein